MITGGKPHCWKRLYSVHSLILMPYYVIRLSIIPPSGTPSSRYCTISSMYRLRLIIPKPASISLKRHWIVWPLQTILCSSWSHAASLSHVSPFSFFYWRSLRNGKRLIFSLIMPADVRINIREGARRCQNCEDVLLWYRLTIKRLRINRSRKINSGQAEVVKRRVSGTSGGTCYDLRRIEW